MTGKDISPVIRVLLADNQVHVRSVLRLLLDEELAHDVLIDEVADAGDLPAALARSQPDLLLLSWELGGERAPADRDGDGLVRRVRQLCPQTTVLVLTVWPDHGRQAVAAGADGFVAENEPPDRLIALIRDWVERKKIVRQA